jgi:hypothetical protein
MDPATLTIGAVVLQAGVNIQSLATVGVGAVIAIMLIFGLVQAGLSVFQARALNNQVAQGIQAIVGVNNMQTVDNAMEDTSQNGGGNVQQANNGGGDGNQR